MSILKLYMILFTLLAIRVNVHASDPHFDELNWINEEFCKTRKSTKITEGLTLKAQTLSQKGNELIGGSTTSINFNKRASVELCNVASKFFINQSLSAAKPKRFNLIATSDLRTFSDSRYAQHMYFGYIRLLSMAWICDEKNQPQSMMLSNNNQIYDRLIHNTKTYFNIITIENDSGDILKKCLQQRFLTSGADNFCKVLSDNFIPDVLEYMNYDNGYRNVFSSGKPSFNQEFIELNEFLRQPNLLDKPFGTSICFIQIDNPSLQKYMYKLSTRWLANYVVVNDLVFITKNIVNILDMSAIVSRIDESSFDEIKQHISENCSSLVSNKKNCIREDIVNNDLLHRMSHLTGGLPMLDKKYWLTKDLLSIMADYWLFKSLSNFDQQRLRTFFEEGKKFVKWLEVEGQNASEQEKLYMFLLLFRFLNSEEREIMFGIMY